MRGPGTGAAMSGQACSGKGLPLVGAAGWRRRETLALATVRSHAAAARAKKVAQEAVLSSAEAMAAAVVIFGGPDKAAKVTGIPANEFRAARRAVALERAGQVAEELASGEKPGGRRHPRPAPAPGPGGRVTCGVRYCWLESVGDFIGW